MADQTAGHEHIRGFAQRCFSLERMDQRKCTRVIDAMPSQLGKSKERNESNSSNHFSNSIITGRI